MFRLDILTIFRESSMTCAAYFLTYRLEFSEVFKFLLCLQFLKSKLLLDRVEYSHNKLNTV